MSRHACRIPIDDLPVFVNHQATDWRCGLGFSFRDRFSRGCRCWRRTHRFRGSGRFFHARRGCRRLGIRLRCRLCRLGGYRKLGLNSVDCQAPAHAPYHPAQEHCQGNDRNSQSAGAVVTGAGSLILLRYRDGLGLRGYRLLRIRYSQ